MGDGEGFEEWDDDFLDQLLQVEQFALSANPTQPPPPQEDISFSPPRELSQWNGDAVQKDFHRASGVVPHSPPSRNPKEEEIQRLTRELGRVTKDLTRLEQNCLQLRKDRDEKEEQLKSVYAQIEAKDAEVQCRKSKNLEYGVRAPDSPGISRGFQNGNSSDYQAGSQNNVVTSTSKAIGVQTDRSGESARLSMETGIQSPQYCRNRLLAIWDSSSGWGSLRNLASKLLVACETDFHVLFRYLGLSSEATMKSLADGRSSEVGLQETTKVSHLYSMLTKIDTGMMNLDALFEALLDLCSLENPVIVYRSLRVLRMAFSQTFSLQLKCYRRDNIIVEGPSSCKNYPDSYGPENAESGSLFSLDGGRVSHSDLLTFRMSLFKADDSCNKKQKNDGSAVPESSLDLLSVFEWMHQITMRITEDCARAEAVSIMNMILSRSNAYLDRENFGKVPVFQSISHLLRKESGLRVQKQAVHLLYLLLNCPKLMAMFCMGCKEELEGAGASSTDVKNAFTSQGFCFVLDGLADCVACGGNDAQDLELRRSAIILLSFLGSSGKPGFEILLGHRLPKRNNFVALILQMLILEMDAETLSSSQPPEIFKKRTLLLREALILLNRLVSNPSYSNPTLRVLTNSRDVAHLTVDAANRLSCRGKWLWQSDGMTRQMRESEIVDLAQVFRKRVFAFLGDSTL
ncbi:protein SENSITIVE TO UV 2 [Diospyros lotus]|uniref:protein SENSITIVE TO UV 2 n=1 Tax=Diospyros lotus TaxID=55363 RepID=UPI00224F3303|nr:protein SENSITIVE TO UV 2 [Diospyros lotus]